MNFRFIETARAKPLKYPISFPVSLLGKELVATITGLVDDPILNSYEISFSDGYTDTFTFSEDGAFAGAKPASSKPYAFVIKNDMECLCLMNPDDKVWNFKSRDENISGNVWVRECRNDAFTMYSVYTAGDYHFHVMQKAGKWISETMRKIEPRPVDGLLASEVIAIITK